MQRYIEILTDAFIWINYVKMLLFLEENFSNICQNLNDTQKVATCR